MGGYCKFDSEHEGRIVVMVNQTGRLIAARQFCDACIASGRALREMGVVAREQQSVMAPEPFGLNGRSLARIVADAIAAAIDSSGGNVQAAAKLLQISRSTMYRHLDAINRDAAQCIGTDEVAG